MKYLIVGLGNIGAEYDNTRHNIGFKVLDALAKASNTAFSEVRHAYRAEMKTRGRTFILIKPTTYMNLSGKAVAYWMQQEKIPLDHLLIICDDLALPFGKIRIRERGSDGGHNGLKNIAESLSTTDFARMRFGIGNEFSRGHQVDFVLGQWTDEEQAKIDERVNLCCQAVQQLPFVGVPGIMNQFNNK